MWSGYATGGASVVQASVERALLRLCTVYACERTSQYRSEYRVGNRQIIDIFLSKQSSPTKHRSPTRVLSAIVLCTLLWLSLPGTNALGQTLAAIKVPTNDNVGAESAAPTAQVYTWYVVLPTYPVEAYLTPQVDPAYNWPYDSFDRERFLEDNPAPEYRAHRVIVLENEVLRVLLLPDLGGRIWQIIHKPTGNTMFYQNTVIKPTPWGPANQLGWLGLGGLEWNLPVKEHGYDWGTPWNVDSFVDENGAAVAKISTPDDGRYLDATITVTLPPDAAYIEIKPNLINSSNTDLQFDYWHNAMLAPGPGNQPSDQLRFKLPTDEVRIHSSGDEALPVDHTVISWPEYDGRELDILGNWNQYSGFFEYPAAHGPYAGVYDPAYDAGAVRIFPADIARGSKVFALGWDDALTSQYYTDDGSSYVELHGGLAPSFFDHAHLAAGESVEWSERWFPEHGIGDYDAASDAGALSVAADGDTVSVGFYAVEPITGEVQLLNADNDIIDWQSISVDAGTPMEIALHGDLASEEEFTVRVVDNTGTELISTVSAGQTD